MKLDRPQIKTWDNVAENYSMTIAEHEKNYANEIINIFKKYNLDKNFSFIELGCGSGHLSGLISNEGYKVSLLDFSKNALFKSSEFFKTHNFIGEFIEGDIFNLPNLNRKFEITWNSGVMEHFDDKALFNALLSIRKITSKYFIMFLPNPESFAYLLHRMKIMKDGDWIYGTEYLRTDYEIFLKQVGFNLVEKVFLFNDPSIAMVDFLSKNSNMTQDYKNIVEAGILDSSKSTVCYVAEICDIPENPIIPNGDTRLKTELFDSMAGYCELNYIPRITLKSRLKKLKRKLLKY